MKIRSVNATYISIVHDDDKEESACLTWSDGKVKHKGDLKKSAKVFKHVCEKYSKRDCTVFAFGGVKKYQTAKIDMKNGLCVLEGDFDKSTVSLFKEVNKLLSGKKEKKIVKAL